MSPLLGPYDQQAFIFLPKYSLGNQWVYRTMGQTLLKEVWVLPPTPQGLHWKVFIQAGMVTSLQLHKMAREPPQAPPHCATRTDCLVGRCGSSPCPSFLAECNSQIDCKWMQPSLVRRHPSIACLLEESPMQYSTHFSSFYILSAILFCKTWALQGLHRCSMIFLLL